LVFGSKLTVWKSGSPHYLAATVVLRNQRPIHVVAICRLLREHELRLRKEHDGLRRKLASQMALLLSHQQERVELALPDEGNYPK
jgi:hypothetical protein